jgi:hypothetical protein
MDAVYVESELKLCDDFGFLIGFFYQGSGRVVEKVAAAGVFVRGNITYRF